MDILAIKNFLNSSEFQATLANILKKFNLSDKKEVVTEIFADILSGKILLFDLADELNKRLEIGKESVDKINTELFVLYLKNIPQQLKDQLNNVKAVTNSESEKKYDFEKLVEELKVDSGLKKIDPNVEIRLKSAISNRLRDIRDNQETTDILTRSPKIGGVGLSSDQAYSLLLMLKNKKEELLKKGIKINDLLQNVETPWAVNETDIDVSAKVKAPQGNFQMPVPPPEVTIEQILAEKAKLNPALAQINTATADTPFVEDIKEEEAFLDSTEELPAPAIVKTPASQTSELPVAPQPISPQSIRPPEIRQPLIRPTEQTANRPQMSDVKFERKLYGPLDELAAMSLADFRRLSKDPVQAGQKISAKLDILEGESVAQKNEGIKALKASPLYKIYAEIMNKALVEGKSFEQVIAERGDINLAEFKAIMELNKSLKY